MRTPARGVPLYLCFTSSMRRDLAFIFTSFDSLRHHTYSKPSQAAHSFAASPHSWPASGCPSTMKPENCHVSLCLLFVQSSCISHFLTRVATSAALVSFSALHASANSFSTAVRCAVVSGRCSTSWQTDQFSRLTHLHLLIIASPAHCELAQHELFFVRRLVRALRHRSACCSHPTNTRTLPHSGSCHACTTGASDSDAIGCFVPRQYTYLCDDSDSPSAFDLSRNRLSIRPT